MVRNYAEDGSLQRRVLPLLNRVVHETNSCYEYRQNAGFYIDVFTLVRDDCIDTELMMDSLLRVLKALAIDSINER